MRESCSRPDASAWIRTHMPKKELVWPKTGEVWGSKVSMTQAKLRRWVRDPSIPKSVRQHIYIWIRYRQRRGFAN